MAIILNDILTKAQLAEMAAALAGGGWADGRESAGAQSARVKSNQQLPPADPVARHWAGKVTEALGRHSGFMAAALPRRITPLTFSRYQLGESYGLHIDNAIRNAGAERLRADLAATLFLSDPADYDGGELIVETSFGAPSIKLPAGQLVLYPANTRHRVAPVTRGERLAVVFWVQSMVRDESRRLMLIELDRAVQALAASVGPENPQILVLTGLYHNLLRQWAES